MFDESKSVPAEGGTAVLGMDSERVEHREGTTARRTAWSRLRVLGALPSGYRRRITDAWPEAEVRIGVSTALCTHVQADAVLVWDCTDDDLVNFVERQPSISWVHTRAVGVDPRLLAITADRGITLTNGRGGHGQAVAEYAMAVILAHLKRLPELHRAQQARCWTEPAPRLAELQGKTVGILGTGDLGSCTARLLRPFGVRTIGIRRQQLAAPDMDELCTPRDLSDVLPRLDVLVIAAPSTPQTRHMIGARELAQLRPSALLVNIGRGAVVDEAALVGALRSQQLAGAALDVFAREPLPPESPLWSMPNVTISPHCADHTIETDERCLAHYLDNVALVRAGKAPLGTVHPDPGY
ncbi:D-2-hydroxyacid dehydrogenase [Streptomyces virginiae]|uniref:D-2-hydroxyacid dehydrogenase n=1 Tax=Streptomyces virginiae TaxID=1961 RepID=UPI00367847B6